MNLGPDDDSSLRSEAMERRRPYIEMRKQLARHVYFKTFTCT